MSSSQVLCNPLSRADSPYPKGGNYLHQVRACEVGTGCVLWLPPKGLAADLECTNKSCSRCDIHLEKGAYDHPVVVLRAPNPRNSDENILVAIITSFKGTSLETYLRGRPLRDAGNLSMPIVKANYTCVDERGRFVKVLGLEQQRELRVQSYVSLQHHCSVPQSRLRQYGYGPAARAYDFRLTKTSYRALMKSTGLTTSPYLTTRTLRSRMESYIADMEVLRNSLPCPVRGYKSPHVLQLPPAEYFQDQDSLSEQSMAFQDEGEMVSPDCPELQHLLGSSRSQETFIQPSHPGCVYSSPDSPASRIRSHESAYGSTLPRWQTSRPHHLRQVSLFRKFILKPLCKVKSTHIVALFSLGAVLATGYGVFVLSRLLINLTITECKALFTLAGHQWRSVLAWIHNIPTALLTLLSNLARKLLHTLHE